MLAKLGFEAVPVSSRKSKGKHKKGGTTGLLWRQPYSLELLHLDRAALKVVAARWGPGQASCIPGDAFYSLKILLGKAGKKSDMYVLTKSWLTGCMHVFAGSSSDQGHIYLSGATLLVVPSTLIQHWIDQVMTASRFSSEHDKKTWQQPTAAVFSRGV